MPADVIGLARLNIKCLNQTGGSCRKRSDIMHRNWTKLPAQLPGINQQAYAIAHGYEQYKGHECFEGYFFKKFGHSKLLNHLINKLNYTWFALSCSLPSFSSITFFRYAELFKTYSEPTGNQF